MAWDIKGKVSKKGVCAVVECIAGFFPAINDLVARFAHPIEVRLS